MHRRKLLFSLILVALLTMLVSGIALAKAHVPAGEVQVSHKGRTAINVDEPALDAHVGHGDIQLPACDFANVFSEGSDTSNVVSADFDGVVYSDIGLVDRIDAGGATPACPPGTF